MVAFSEALKNCICEAVTEHDDILQQSMRDQWTKLIHQPLLKLKSDLGTPLILVVGIDALDECRRPEDIRLLLHLLAEAKDLEIVQLRVLVTSRPEMKIRLGFAELSRTVRNDFFLHETGLSLIRHDIAVCFSLKIEMYKIREKHSLELEWPGERMLEMLVDRSGGLFIYAATVCRFIGDSRCLPDKRLEIVLQDDAPQSPIQALDSMYTQVLISSVIGDCDEEEEETLGQYFRASVASLIVLFDPLYTVVLARPYPALSETIDTTLCSL